MKQTHRQRMSFLFTSLLYGCGLFIFLEWLYPVRELTDTSDIHLFIIYAVFCFLISFVGLRWWQSFLLKGLGWFIFIYLLFFDGGFLGFAWVQALIEDGLYNIQALLAKDWDGLTAIFRGNFFLGLIWLMSYLVHYWFIVAKRSFLFMSLTIIYLAILDTFTIYDAQMAIVRVFILSFLALGVTNLFSMIQHESTLFAKGKLTVKWLFPLIFIVLSSALLGYTAPKLAPQWPDPSPTVQNMTGMGPGSHSEKKEGYGEDDAQLGGDFAQDDQEVFQAVASEEHYWRIETKDIYTGKGWESSSADQTLTTQNHIPLTTFSDTVDTEKKLATINMAPPVEIPKLVYPYGLDEVRVNDDVDFVFDKKTEEVRTQVDGSDIHLADYMLVYQHPSFAVDSLKASNSDPEEVKERYTQLPERLPERISTLAEEITDPFTNRYEQVVALEQYFGQSGEFTYQTDSVPIPAEDQDYVDQFLFDSKVGYCDNYSTSMVVMLRTLGIPARWVKGFTSGEDVTADVPEQDISDGYHVYEVKNENAHSWVEVYFPDVGWVPFEPTQGFSNLTDFYEEGNGEAAEDALEVPDAENDNPESEEDESLNRDDEEEETALADSLDEQADESLPLKPWYFAIVAVLTGIVLFYLYRKRYSIKAYYLGKKMAKQQNSANYQDAYHFLLQLLDDKGDGKEPQQTLREYAKQIDVLYTTKAMSLLTQDYEQLLYNEVTRDFKNNEFPQLWKDLVHRIMS